MSPFAENRARPPLRRNGTSVQGRPWYEVFFRGLALEHWSERFSARDTAEDVDFLLGALSAPRGGRLLDVPCGDGRHLLALADRGYRMTGVDIAPAYIRSLRRRANAATVLLRADMSDLTFTTKFDGAYCFGNSFGYLERAANADMIRRIGAALKPGARFVLDTSYAAESIIPNFQTRFRAREGRFSVAIRSSYDAAASTVLSEYRLGSGGRTVTRHARFCVYTIAELTAILKDAKLDIVACVSGLSGSPFSLGDERVILISERRSTARDSARSPSASR